MRSTTRVLRNALFGTAASAAMVLGGASAASAEPVGTLQAPCVQRIAVVNNAGFVQSFSVFSREGLQAPATDQYAINQWRVVDLTATALPVGAEVRPVVSAVAGNTVPGNTFVTYCQNGQTATYSTTGTTMNYTVTLIT